MKQAPGKHWAMRAIPLAVAMAWAPNLLAQTTLEEVVVTSQRRLERLQDIPLSITSLTGAEMEQRGMEGASSLRGAVPNLNMAPAPVSGLIGSVGMRGMGSGQPSIWADPAVGVYVDGVFVGKNQGILTDLVDIDRLEVLRGPQGTLFGRNTQAGAINFVTRRPSGEFSGSVGVEAGTHGRQVERISIDLPKTQSLSLSVAARNETQDGAITNALGQSWGDKDRQGLRLAARLEPSSSTVMDYSYDKTEINEGPQVGSLVSSTGYLGNYSASGQTSPGFVYKYYFQPGLGAMLKPYANPDYPSAITANVGELYQRVHVTGNTLSVSHKLDAANSIKYIFGQRRMIYGDRSDYDQTPVNVYTGQRDTEYTTRSHEFQFTGNKDALKYVAGVYAFMDDGTTLSRQSGSFFTFDPRYLGYKLVNFNVTTEAKAAFGQIDYDISKQATLTGGMRYTSETKGVHAWRDNSNASFAEVGAATLDSTAQASFSAFTPSAAAVYKIDANTNVFARIAGGFKSGGFPAEAPLIPGSSSPTTPFKPEKSTSYEAGTKMSLMGGKGQLSVTGFLTKVTDMQLSLLPAGSGTPTMVNAGEATTKGIEVEAQFLPTSGVRLHLGYGFLDAAFDKFESPGVDGKMVDAASNTVMPGAPKHTLNLGLDARIAKNSLGTWRAIVDMRHISSRYTYAGQISATAPNSAIGNSAAESLMPALTTVNARLLLADVNVGGPGSGSVSLWMKNVFDERKMVAHMDVGGYYQVGFWSEPRTVGLNFNYKW